jgi:hypothetical protein
MQKVRNQVGDSIGFVIDARGFDKSSQCGQCPVSAIGVGDVGAHRSNFTLEPA